MKIGDIVTWEKKPDFRMNPGFRGLVVGVDETRRQKTITVMKDDGTLVERVWVGHVEVVND